MGVGDGRLPGAFADGASITFPAFASICGTIAAQWPVQALVVGRDNYKFSHWVYLCIVSVQLQVGNLGKQNLPKTDSLPYNTVLSPL